jgi:hypothetical protein
MSEQNDAAAERSAHVERGPRRIPGESFLVEVSPGVFQIKAVAEAVAEAERLRAERDRLREALRLADAALSGANMNMGAVEKKVRAALRESDA